MLKKVSLALLTLLLFPSPTFSQTNIEIVDSPETVAIEKEFSLFTEVAASSLSQYYVKARGGAALNSLRSSLTYNEATKSWLSDTTAWTKFPTFTTDQNGFWSGSLKVKYNSKTPLGDNLLVLRIRKVGTSKNLDSPPVAVLVTEVSQTSQSQVQAESTTKTSAVVLNEFSPAPAENKEWVELYNPGSQDADIGGWKIDDIDGGSKPVVIPTGNKVKTKGFFVVYFSSKLNNSGDSVRLLNPQGTQVEKYSYSKVAKGTVFAKDSRRRWEVTTTPTPGKKNKITEPVNDQSASSVQSITDSSESFVDPDSAGISSLTEILGISNPSSFGTPVSENQVAQTKGASSKNNNQKSSFSTIFVGLGLILLGGAVGLPLIKRQAVETNVNGNKTN